MYRRLLHVQIAMMALMSCSSLLLGISIGDVTLVATSIIGAIVAFIFVDRLKWIELSGWFANIVSVGVLIFTMKEFIGAGSAGKLVAVAYLLTYLLTVLMFQKEDASAVLAIACVKRAANFFGGHLQSEL